MKKKLYNQKDRPQLKAELAAENFTRMTFSFYRYVNIDNPNALRDELYKEWNYGVSTKSFQKNYKEVIDLISSWILD